MFDSVVEYMMVYSGMPLLGDGLSHCKMMVHTTNKTNEMLPVARAIRRLIQFLKDNFGTLMIQ